MIGGVQKKAVNAICIQQCDSLLPNFCIAAKLHKGFFKLADVNQSPLELRFQWTTVASAQTFSSFVCALANPLFYRYD